MNSPHMILSVEPKTPSNPESSIFDVYGRNHYASEKSADLEQWGRRVKESLSARHTTPLTREYQ